jgi:CRISPR-associated protein Csd2
MTLLMHKVDFALVLRVINANPNGDPLNGNRPRISYEGIGEITDVCLKRKLRDRLQESGTSIYVQSDGRETDGYRSLAERAKATLGTKLSGPHKDVIDIACKTWFDVRAFGNLFAIKAAKSSKKLKSKDEINEDSEGDSGVSIGIRGPVTIQSAFSQGPVEITSTQITKSVSGEGDGSKKSSDTMGMKHRVDQGIYVSFGSMNPQLAERTGFSDEDAALIKSILPRLFENDASAARPEGSMEVLKVIWWQHPSKSGVCSSAKVHRSLVVEPDGVINVAKIDGLEPEIIDGF